MDDAGDILNDPNFPDRPSHPDFWHLSSVILQMDGRVEEAPVESRGDALQSLVAESIDIESVTYMAGQRAMRWCALAGIPFERGVIMAMAALYMEAVCVGIRFAEARGKQ